MSLMIDERYAGIVCAGTGHDVGDRPATSCIRFATLPFVVLAWLDSVKSTDASSSR